MPDLDALPLIVDSLDVLPDALRTYYAPGPDGKGFRLKAVGVSGDDVGGLKANYNRLQSDLKKAQERLRQMGDVDPDEYRALKEAREKAEEERARAAGEFDKLKAAMAEKHAAEIKKAQDEADRLRRAVFREIAENGLLRELQDVAISPALLLPHMVSHLQVVPKDGNPDAYEVRVVDPESKSVRVRDGGGALMGLKDLVAEFQKRPEFAPAFRGTGAAGSGAPGGANGGGGSTPPGTVAITDTAGFLANLDGIGKGTVKVVG